MCHARTVVRVLALVAFLVPPTLARAQVFQLRACNRGSVPVQVVVAHAQGTFVYSWAVAGKTIAPGWCDEFPGQSLEALIAFGARDSRGRFVSLKPTTLPDLGDRATTLVEIAQNGGQLRTPVLSRDNRTICVAPTNTFYSTMDTRIPTPAECPQLTLPDVGTLVPITTSYYVSSPPGVLTMYHVNVSANSDRGEVTMTEADMNDVDKASGASVADTANTPRTALLLGRRVSVGADGRHWYFDDGSVAFDDLGLGAPDTFFDLQPRQGASIAPAEMDRLGAIMIDVNALLKPTDVRVNFDFKDWGARGRLCFEWGGNIRCANVEGLDFDATTFTESGVMFHCRGTGGCAFIAAPWTTSDGARVRLNDRDWTLSTPQRALFVSHLPNQQAARTLAAKIREFGEIFRNYRDPAR